MPTVLITGCSSGFGLETATLFLEKGWRCVATMRQPKADILPLSANLVVLPPDVTDPGSIARAVGQAGEIDVLVNDAGFGAAGPVELIEPRSARQLFETNTLGALAVLQAILPDFRQRRGGVIINVTSKVTLKPLPLVSVYHAIKAAVNALTESLAVEMEPFGVRVRIALPGRSPETNFGNAMSFGKLTAEMDADALGPLTASDRPSSTWRLGGGCRGSHEPSPEHCVCRIAN